MEVKRRLLERIVDPSYTEGLRDKAMAALRTMREECRDGETEVSFERRLCQARIDILSAELERRSGNEDVDLLARLPEILAAEGRAPSRSPLPDRAPDFSIPRNADVPRRRVEEIVGEQTLAKLPQVATEELKGIIESLGSHERDLSGKRQEIHTVMDKIQAEIVRRYTSGEADPAAVLG